MVRRYTVRAVSIKGKKEITASRNFLCFNSERENVKALEKMDAFERVEKKKTVLNGFHFADV